MRAPFGSYDTAAAPGAPCHARADAASSEVAPPPIEVQRGFGRVGLAERFASGEGAAFRVADGVFKPVADRLEAEWIGGVLDDLPETSVRVARPIRAAEGGWVICGWIAGSGLRDVSRGADGTRSRPHATKFVAHYVALPGRVLGHAEAPMGDWRSERVQ
jgi:hypothetical protein